MALAGSLACTNPTTELADRGIERSSDQLVAQAAAGSTETVELLIRSGIPVDGRDQNGNTALLAACDGGHAETVETLVRAGADVDLATRSSAATPLGIAAIRGFAPIVRILLDAGADLEPREAAQKMTPLIGAAFAGNSEIVAMLIEAGADVAARDTDGWTALDHAQQQHHTDAERLLIGAGAPAEGGLPAGWTLTDPFDDTTRYWPEYASFSTKRDPAVTHRILLRSGVDDQAQILLAVGDSMPWRPRVEREIEQWRTDPLLRASGKHQLTTADGIELALYTFRIGEGLLAGRSISKLLGYGSLPNGQLLIIDAGGDPGSPGIAHVESILERSTFRSLLGDP